MTKCSVLTQYLRDKIVEIGIDNISREYCSLREYQSIINRFKDNNIFRIRNCTVHSSNPEHTIAVIYDRYVGPRAKVFYIYYHKSNGYIEVGEYK